MLSEDRIAAVAEKILSTRLRHSTIEILRAFAAECEEAGAFVECETCDGVVIDGVASQTSHDGKEHWTCDTCDGEGRIRRELAGALDVATFLDEHKSISNEEEWKSYEAGFSTATAIAFGRARNQWAKKAKEEE